MVPDKELWATSDNCSSLSSDSSLILVASNLEMLTVLLYLLSNIMHGLHGINIGLLDDYLEVLWLILLVLGLSSYNVELSPLVHA